MKCDITQELLKRLFSYDGETGLFTRLEVKSRKYKPGSIAGSLSCERHQKIIIRYKKYYIHHLAWLYVYGDWPESSIDHINGDPTDNRIDNLRTATHSQNLLNRSKQSNNKSGYKNVSWSKVMGAWEVRMRINKKTKIIGFFDDVIKANEAAISARAAYQGQYAIERRASV